METARRFIFIDILSAAAISAAILLTTVFCAQKLVDSNLYKQSKVISMLVQQDSVGISGMLEDKQNIRMAVQFAGALTSAYINFELIPVNEVSTFVAVFESLPENVSVEGFEYRRKDLTITGVADSEKAYGDFIKSLEGRDYFASITGHSYESDGGKTRFEIVCASDASEVYLNFDNLPLIVFFI